MKQINNMLWVELWNKSLTDIEEQLYIKLNNKITADLYYPLNKPCNTMKDYIVIEIKEHFI